MLQASPSGTGSQSSPADVIASFNTDDCESCLDIFNDALATRTTTYTSTGFKVTDTTTSWKDSSFVVPTYTEHSLVNTDDGQVTLYYWTDPASTFETGNKVYASLVKTSLSENKGDLSKSQVTGGLNHNNKLAADSGVGTFDKTTGNGTLVFTVDAGTYVVYTTAKN